MKLATLCYIKKNGKTLMLKRDRFLSDIHFGKWNGLGGKLKPGESPEEALSREVLEESGLLVHTPKLSGFLTFPEFKDAEDWYVFVYTVRDFEGELIDSPEGTLAWIPDADLLSLPLWEGDKHFLPWLAQGKLFSAKFVYKSNKLADFSVCFY